MTLQLAYQRFAARHPVVVYEAGSRFPYRFSNLKCAVATAMSRIRHSRGSVSVIEEIGGVVHDENSIRKIYHQIQMEKLRSGPPPLS